MLPKCYLKSSNFDYNSHVRGGLATSCEFRTILSEFEKFRKLIFKLVFQSRYKTSFIITEAKELIWTNIGKWRE
jgi:hypothetical protein